MELLFFGLLDVQEAHPDVTDINIKPAAIVRIALRIA